jgi:GNAT superfamily N-acetyltransferase
MGHVALRFVSENDVSALVSLVADLPEWFHKGVPEEVRLDCARCAGLVAEVEGAIAGFVLWVNEAEVFEIKWLAVMRERHRQGIGSLLIDGLVQTAGAAGAKRISVDTLAPTHDYEPYARSRAFYEARGFQLSRIEHGGFPEGSDKATYVLALKRNPTEGES